MWNVNIVRSKNITLRQVKILGSRCENNDLNPASKRICEAELSLY
jgi:hypothetical protein